MQLFYNIEESQMHCHYIPAYPASSPMHSLHMVPTANCKQIEINFWWALACKCLMWSFQGSPAYQIWKCPMLLNQDPT